MCTRFVYLGSEDTIITGRTMDWKSDMGTNLWAFPRGIKLDGAAGPKSIQWTSKYGSVVAAGFDVGSADGINEKGLVANMLYLVETEYPIPTSNGPRKPLFLSAWAHYVLDNYVTVAEAVEDLCKEPFYIVPGKTPDGQECVSTPSANITMLCSVLLRHGIDHLRTIEREMRKWMEEHEYKSVKQMQGSMSQKNCPDPSAFERAQYMRALQTYKPEWARVYETSYYFG